MKAKKPFKRRAFDRQKKIDFGGNREASSRSPDLLLHREHVQSFPSSFAFTNSGCFNMYRQRTAARNAGAGISISGHHGVACSHPLAPRCCPARRHAALGSSVLSSISLSVFALVSWIATVSFV